MAFPEEDEDVYDIKAWDDPLKPDSLNHDSRVIYGRRASKKIPATMFTTGNHVAGRDPMDLPVRKLLYRETQSYDFRMIANGKLMALLGARSTHEFYMVKSLFQLFRSWGSDAFNLKEMAVHIANHCGLKNPTDKE